MGQHYPQPQALQEPTSKTNLGGMCREIAPCHLDKSMPTMAVQIPSEQVAAPASGERHQLVRDGPMCFADGISGGW